jgi:hypothetical protein
MEMQNIIGLQLTGSSTANTVLVTVMVYPTALLSFVLRSFQFDTNTLVTLIRSSFCSTQSNPLKMNAMKTCRPVSLLLLPKPETVLQL